MAHPRSFVDDLSLETLESAGGSADAQAHEVAALAGADAYLALPDEAWGSPEARLLLAAHRRIGMAALAKMDDVDAALVRGFYGGERSLRSLAGELGISEATAKRRHAGALLRVRAVAERLA